jgi:hypothetical protein
MREIAAVSLCCWPVYALLLSYQRTCPATCQNLCMLHTARTYAEIEDTEHLRVLVALLQRCCWVEAEV